MIDHIVRYLHGARVPFRLASYPSEEALPTAAHPLPPGGLLVDTKLFVVDGRPTLACFAFGESPEPRAIGAALGRAAIDGTADDLPDELRYAGGPVPPLGQLYGFSLVVDERVRDGAILVFRAFGESVYFEVPYEDFARLEQPRVASFASAGELGEGAGATKAR